MHSRSRRHESRVQRCGAFGGQPRTGPVDDPATGLGTSVRHYQSRYVMLVKTKTNKSKLGVSSLSFDVYPIKGDLIYAVNGPTSPVIPVRGFTINPMTENIVDHWKLSKDAVSIR